MSQKEARLAGCILPPHHNPLDAHPLTFYALVVIIFFPPHLEYRQFHQSKREGSRFSFHFFSLVTVVFAQGETPRKSLGSMPLPLSLGQTRGNLHLEMIFPFFGIVYQSQQRYVNCWGKSLLTIKKIQFATVQENISHYYSIR